ncbi:MAG: hypothetical protein CMP71_01580 [Flavobacteriales bacterium]|mgnify:CR=1 FL=1|nr:hypothetical protein [Flavobacteriales bacterium]|tara:strand:+ start:12355 stop:13548 length:1194 start_codon:yes stop_codon:yes gene_type:complete
MTASIGVVGLGYVGLKIYHEFSKYYEVNGFDISKERIIFLKKKYNNIKVDDDVEIIKNCNVYIVAVPTNVCEKKIPILSNLKDATLSISKLLEKGNNIIYLSTVFPGTTEKLCMEIIHKETKLKLNKDFGLAYCPERVNPGENHENFINSYKVISASNKKTLKVVKKIYNKVFPNIYLSDSLKSAEAIKIFENIQRDINIAYLNLITKICKEMKINTNCVIDGMQTKWNSLDFKPGLVGGNCISVNPYYIIEQESVLCNIDLIKNARQINSTMYKFVGQEIEKIFKKKKVKLKNVEILLVGLTYKKNIKSISNSQSIKLLFYLKEKCKQITAFDPLVSKKYLPKNLKKHHSKFIPNKKFGLIIYCVDHDIFCKDQIKKMNDSKTLFYNVSESFSISC